MVRNGLTMGYNGSRFQRVVTSKSWSSLNHAGLFLPGKSKNEAMRFSRGFYGGFLYLVFPYPWRIHGAAIYGNMDPINIPPLC